ncbi:MAG: radical SAM (seleno)protein TrsS [Bacillota bacterium]|nr:radical SAM protein [Bacillota bacterium]
MTGEEFLGGTESLCPHCLTKIPAFKVLRQENVYLVKNCPRHGLFEALLWRGQPDYRCWARPKIPSQPKVSFTEIQKGCPFDCGLCPDHRQHSCTVLLEVTQSCNLNCTYCFAAAGDYATADPSLDTIEVWYKKILEAGGPYNIQLSGGEPTLRDDLPEIVRMGHRLGFTFIQLNTNGLRLARDRAFVQRLKEAGLTSVFLQFDGTEDSIYHVLRGKPLFKEKEQAIRHCAEENLGVVLVPTLVPGVNVHNIGSTLDFALGRLPAVRGIHFQPVSYFGRYPEAPADSDRITIPDIMREIEKQSGGRIKADSFRPPGCENALCSFHGNYVLMPSGELRSLTKHDACCTKPERAEEGAARARNFAAKQWSAPVVRAANFGTGGGSFALWDAFIERTRTHSFSISGMAFQDAWNLDLERLKDCCIHVLSPAGKPVPFCAYNLTDNQGRPLYRGGMQLWK